MALVALAGCSLVLDGSRHLGGDAGDGGDGGDPCAQAPTAICGAPVDETCPPLPQSQLASIVPDREPLGQLRTTVLFENEQGILPEIAMGAVEDEGELHGTAVVLAIERIDDADRPRRYDVPLHDLLAAEQKPLTYLVADEPVEIPSATSVAIARESVSEPILGMGIMNSAGLEHWSGQTNVVTLETNVTRHDATLDESLALLDDIGAVPGFLVFRSENKDSLIRIEADYNQMVVGPPVPLNVSQSGVPSGAPLRMLTAADYQVAIQDQQGTFWTWAVLQATNPVEFVRAGQSGKAAWAALGAGAYVLAYQADGSVIFETFQCNDFCAPGPVLGNLPSISTVAPTGEVPSAVALPDGRVAALVTERYAEGDRLVLQLLDASLLSVSLPRVPLLDLRETGERVADAEIQYVESDLASTVLVAVAIGAEPEVATRVVLTGLRSCATGG